MATKYQVVRRFAVGELITLFQIDLTSLGGTVQYFTNNIFEERVPIVFGGNTYIHMPCDLEGVEISADAGPAQPKFQIATAGGPVAALVAQYKDLRGAKVYRLKTFAEFLDQKPDGSGGVIANPTADATAVLQKELYVVDRKVSANSTFAEFQLVSPLDQEGIQLPLRIVRKRWCDRQYRMANPDGSFTAPPSMEDGGCPYIGTRYFNEQDVATSAPNDHCSKQFSGCQARFGKGTALPFSGFPGVRGTSEA